MVLEVCHLVGLSHDGELTHCITHFSAASHKIQPRYFVLLFSFQTMYEFRFCDWLICTT